MRSMGALETLAARQALADPPVPEYASELVEGVARHREEIDRSIARYAEGWTLERMPAVDRNILRIAVLELFWRDDVPDRVAIDEAVRLAKTISTDRSPAFVNGLLASLLEEKPDGRRPAAPGGARADGGKAAGRRPDRARSGRPEAGRAEAGRTESTGSNL